MTSTANSERCRSPVLWGLPGLEWAYQLLDYPDRRDLPCHMNRKAPPGVLVLNGRYHQGSTITHPLGQQVITSNMGFSAWLAPVARPVVNPGSWLSLQLL
jgi:hypothetical protein